MEKNIILYLTMDNKKMISNDYNDEIKKYLDNGNYEIYPILIDENDWNHLLSPWSFMDEEHHKNFRGEGKILLNRIINEIIPNIEKENKSQKLKYIIAGYSLAGMFGLWSLYQTDIFSGTISCSGSLWFPKMKEYILSHKLNNSVNIYLSLGKKEEKVRDYYMCQVGNYTREIFDYLNKEEYVSKIIFEWNEGNHFHKISERMNKGFIWMFQNL